MNEPATLFIQRLFESLEQDGIEYVVARRADLLPHPPVGDDIDIVVLPEKLSRVGVVLNKLAPNLRGHCFSSNRFQGSAQYMFFFPSSADGLRVVHLDFQDSISHHGVILVPANVMLEGRRCEGGVWRPSPCTEAATLLLHDLATKGAFRTRDLEQIRDVYGREPAAFVSVLQALTTAKITRQVASGLDKGNEFGPLLSIRRAVLLRSTARRPIRALQWWLGQLLRNISYVFRRRGALVALVGPDGSGKTTLAEEIVRLLNSCGQKAERFYFGVTTPLLPTKRWMKARHSKRRAGQERRNERIPRNATFMSNLIFFLGICHSLLDQLLRYWAQARLPLSRARILVFDRYFYDALTSPAPGGLKWLLDWSVVHLTPRPDIVFFLMDSPRAIHDRKPELAVDEIERQQRAMKILCIRPIHAREITIGPDPQPNALAMSREILIAFGRRNG